MRFLGWFFVLELGDFVLDVFGDFFDIVGDLMLFRGELIIGIFMFFLFFCLLSNWDRCRFLKRIVCSR